MSLDGLPPGVIRNKKWNTHELTAEQWCKDADESSPFHVWSNTQQKFCTICGVDKHDYRARKFWDDRNESDDDFEPVAR